jgi:hypothetical protein
MTLFNLPNWKMLTAFLPGAGALGLSAALVLPAWAGEVRPSDLRQALLTQPEAASLKGEGELETSTEADLLLPESETGEMAPEALEEESLTEPAMEESLESSNIEPISSDELEQFASAIPQLIALEQMGEEQANQTINQSSLASDRFYEIYQSQVQGAPSNPEMAAVTPEEQASFESVLGEIQTIMEAVRNQQRDVIVSTGLEPERFNEIMAAVLEDPALQLEVEEFLR